MKTVERVALVQYSAQAMYGLVEDIQAYPSFLPWCDGTEVLKRDESVTVATIHIAYRGIRQQFTTENFKQPGSGMAIRLVNGPFKHLHGEWRFTSLSEDACKIEFKLSYELANGFLERLIGPVFHHIADTLLDAFVTRAESLHAASGHD